MSQEILLFDKRDKSVMRDDTWLGELKIDNEEEMKTREGKKKDDGREEDCWVKLTSVDIKGVIENEHLGALRGRSSVWGCL